MPFEVIFHEAFAAEFDALPEAVQDELLVRTGVIERFGPGLGRPNVDTLNGSAYPNMKELRFQLDGVWRFAFAWDPTGRPSSSAEVTRKGPIRKGSTRT